MSHRKRWIATTAVIVTLLMSGVAVAATIDPVNRSVTTDALSVDWDEDNPEEIVALHWNGSGNLTNTSTSPGCPDDLEFFGNSWVSQDEGTDDFVFVSLVGWGTTGTWKGQGSDGVKVDSSSSGCPGSAGVKVQTRYQFTNSGAGANKFAVTRKVFFGGNQLLYDFRPYIPRLYPRTTYSQVLHPNTAATILSTEDSMLCDFGCQVADWDGSWFAIHDPTSGSGLIVKRPAGSPPAALWVDQDTASNTSSSAVLLLKPSKGFTGMVEEKELLCFYNSTLWVPSLTLPSWCN